MANEKKLADARAFAEKAAQLDETGLTYVLGEITKRLLLGSSKKIA